MPSCRTFAAALLVVAACGGSLPRRVRFAGPPPTELLGGIKVRVEKAEAREHSVLIHLDVINVSGAPLRVDREGFGLRLPDGRTVPRKVPTIDRIVVVGPQEVRALTVEFLVPDVDVRTATSLDLIVGGVSFGNDPTQREVGELSLAPTGG